MASNDQSDAIYQIFWYFRCIFLPNSDKFVRDGDDVTKVDNRHPTEPVYVNLYSKLEILVQANLVF